MRADEPVACSLCGSTVDALPLTWTTSLEHGRTRYYCDRCSRENLRAMEGRLDGEWFAD
jgi:DNA-directed RNA polymerase subunit RPC12/RpoP